MYPILGTAADLPNLPNGGQVTAGAAAISAPNANSLLIQQASQRAIVKWNDFGIGQGKLVTFAQPNVQASTLNIVTGNNPSILAGTLRANGSVFLINQNGIAITPTGLVDVRAGFIASTLRINENEFMKGRHLFEGRGGSVVNQGSILTGEGGMVGLLGGTVSNEGMISAPLGRVALASGATATLDLSGDGFLQVMLPADAVTAEGQALVSNSGVIQADGGLVTLKAATVRQALREAVHMPGEIRATGVSGKNGAIVLEGGAGGKVNVSGKLNADGAGGEAQGGRIDVSGNAVTLAGATLSATGAERGGLVRIGGEFQGGRSQEAGSEDAARYVTRFGETPAVASASTTSIDGLSRIDVSATGEAGVGGTAIVWSNDRTDMLGAIAARGAATGGAIEISSKSSIQSVALNRLDIGRGGRLLLDPQDIVISSAATTDVAGNYLYGSGGATNLKDSDVTALLSSGVNVTLQASNDISWNNNFTFVNNPSGAGGNLNISAGRSVTLSGTFSMDDGEWTIVANDRAANGVDPALRGTGSANIDTRFATFINNSKLNLYMEDGAGNGGGLADGSNGKVNRIFLGDFAAGGLTATIAPTAAALSGVPQIWLNTNHNITGADDINLTAQSIMLSGNITSTNGNINLTTPLLRLSASIGPGPDFSPLPIVLTTNAAGKHVTWTNEKTGGDLTDGVYTIKFIENGVMTRFGRTGSGDATRLELGSATAFSRVYGDADPTSGADFGALQLKLASHNDRLYSGQALPSGVTLDMILAAGSLSVVGPGVTTDVGTGNTLTLTQTANLAVSSSLFTGSYFIDLTPGTVPLSITQRPLTPGVSNGTYVYGSPTSVATLGNIVNGDAIVPVAMLNSTTGVTMAANGGGYGFGATTVPAGASPSNFSLTGISGAKAGNYSIDVTGMSATLDVSKKQLTYLGGSGSQTYGTLGSMPTAALTGVVGSDDVDSVVKLRSGGAPVVLTDRLGAGGYSSFVESLTGITAGNYSISGSGNTDGTYTVNPKSITYSVANAASTTYGTLATLGASTLSGLLSGDVVTGTVGLVSGSLSATTPAGDHSIVVAGFGGAAAGNYVVAGSGNQPGNLHIDQKVLTYTGSNLSQLYGVSTDATTLPAPALNGIVGGDVVNAAGQLLATNTNSGTTGGSGALTIGIYTVGLSNTLTGASSGNYVLGTGTNNEVTITPKPITFSFPAGTTSSTYGTLATLPAGTLGSGILSGDLVTHSTQAFGSGNTIVPVTATTSAGTYSLGVGFVGTGKENYVANFTGSTPGTLVVDPKTITWQVANGSAIYGDAMTNAVTFNALVGSDILTSTVSGLTSGGAPIARPGVGAHAAGVAAISGPLAGNYTLASSGNTEGTVTIDPRPVTYSIANASSVYGTLATLGAVTLSNVVPGDSPSFTQHITIGGVETPLAARISVGDYVQGLSSINDSNYTLAGADLPFGILSVARKPVSFVAPNITSVYGTAANFTSGTLSGVLSGDDAVAGMTNQLNGSGAFALQNAGIYTGQLKVSDIQGAAANNYTLTNTGSTFGTLTIDPKPITYSLNLQYQASALGSTATATYATLARRNDFADSVNGQGALVTLSGLVGSDVIVSAGVEIGVNPNRITMTPNVPVIGQSTGGYIPVGTYTWSGVTLAGPAASNYVIASTGNTNATLTVTPRALPMELQLLNGNSLAPSFMYGNGAGYTLSAFHSTFGDDISAVMKVSTPTGDVNSIPARIPVGSYTIALDSLNGADAANYIPQPTGRSFTVTPRPVTAQVGNVTTTYGDQATVPVPTLAGVLSGDTVGAHVDVLRNGTGSPVTLVPRSAAGGYEFRPTSLTGASAGNYFLSPNEDSSGFTRTTSGTLAINQRLVGYTINPAILSLTYGDMISSTGALTGVLSGDTVGVDPLVRWFNPRTLREEHRNLTASTLLDNASYALLLSLNGAEGGNYRLPDMPGGGSFATIAVAKKAITISVPDRTTTYGSSVVAAQPVLSGAVHGDVLVPLLSTFDGSGNAITYNEQTDAGNYTTSSTFTSAAGSVSQTGLVAYYNYYLDTANSTAGNLTIQKKNLTLSVLPSSSITYGSTVNMGTLSGILFGDDVGVKTNATGSIQSLKLNNGNSNLTYTPRLDAGTYSYTVSNALTGSKSGNYNIVSGGSGSVVVTPKQILYRVDAAEGQYGNYKACPGTVNCNLWEPGITLGATHLDGVLSGDTVSGTRAVIDLNGVTGTINSTTPVGSYFQVVTGLTGSSAHNYTIAPTGSVPGVLTITPVWMTWDTSSAVYVPGTGLVGFPGVANLYVGPDRTSSLNGDQVQPVVVGRFLGDGSVFTDFDALKVGRYTFPVVALTGADAGNYRLRGGSIGTLDVFGSTSLGLDFAKSGVAAPPPPPVITPPTNVSVPTSLKAETGTGKDAQGFGRDIKIGTATNVTLGSTGGSVGAAAGGSVTTGANLGAANFSANASGATDALLTFGVSGVALRATAGGHVDVMMTVGPGYVMYGLQGDAAVNASLGTSGAALSAQAVAGIYEKAGIAGSLGSAGSGSADATVGTFVFATAQGAATYKDGKVVTKLESSVGAGASAGGHAGISGSTGNLDVGATVYTPGSLGGEFAWTGGVSGSALTVGLDLGAKIGIGGLALSINFTVDPLAMVSAIGNSSASLAIAGAMGMSTAPINNRVGTDQWRANENASGLANNPAARYAYLMQNPDWGKYSTNDSASTKELNTAYASNAKFMSDYQSLLSSTVSAIKIQADTQVKFLDLLKTDPKAAVAFAHAGGISQAAGAQNSVIYEASRLGLQMAVVNGQPTFVNKSK